MAAKRKWSERDLKLMRDFFSTNCTNKEVGFALGCDYNRSIKPYWIEWFGTEAVHDRFRRLCAISKTGNKNPMYGKFLTEHHRHKDSYVNWQGYRYIDAPEWYTGSKKGTKVMEHVAVGCKKYNLTELPKGHVFHHVDEDKLNNDPDNLQLLTISEHMEVHAELRRISQGVTTIPKGSRLQEKSKRAAS